VQRLRALSEAECYARCYAAKSDTVRVVSIEPRRRRYEPNVSGELVRQHFEALLESRDPDDLAEPEAA
jgi:hypothetical protein